MKTCITCGMPLEGEHAGDIGLETPEGLVCIHDIVDGQIKKPEDVFEGGVRFFLSINAGDRDLAERITRKNMNSLPYWKSHPCEALNGPEATDEEFQAVLAKM
ncbi:MAG: hypothetical protein KIH65_001730 [Candidatus Uhrbacteria bacterium]|nr:hypothetical protein [Candidatus Uhrbacteria bacterium]